MTFFEVYFSGLLIIPTYVTLAWILSVYIKNASIADIFRGMGFVPVSTFCFYISTANTALQIIALVLVSIWGLRRSTHIFIKNFGNPEFGDYTKRTCAFIPWFSMTVKE